jgi:hypothetical protein
MALTDIVSEGGESSAAARGDIGTLTDILSRDGMSGYCFLTVPAIADVKSGVEYGQQGTELTGTYIGGGGVYPVEGDVDAGVVYGPSSNLTGTLEQPAPTDVKLGVQYGADGTEFTGELAGGAGSTWMRAR